MIKFAHPPSIVATSAVGGKKEGMGPYGDRFDRIFEDEMLGTTSWELAEAHFQLNAVEHLYKKTDRRADILLAGDLQSQCTASSMTARELGLPFVGMFGACSTIAETLASAACFVAGGFSKNALCLTSSHFCSAERQFRTPLDYGAKRTSTAQWTVTAAAAALVARADKAPFITGAMFGRVIDLAVSDPANMGAAMAPAALDTLSRYLKNSNTKPEDYDKIYTGDLGLHGSDMFLRLAENEGLTVKNHTDCGCEIFDTEKQNVECGGSGCGCSASILGMKIIPDLLNAGRGRVLFMATGALLSPVTVGQTETIPGIAHIIELNREL